MFRVTFIISDFTEDYLLRKICNEVKEEYEGEFEFYFFKSKDIDKNESEYDKLEEILKNSNILFILIHGEIYTLKKYSTIKEKYGSKIPIFLNTTSGNDLNEINLDKMISEKIFYNMTYYFVVGGEKNYKNMILYTATIFSKKKYLYEECEKLKSQGIYYKGKIIDNEKEFVKYMIDKPIIVVLYHSKNWELKRKEVIDKFLFELEKKNVVAYGVFTSLSSKELLGTNGIDWIIENYLKFKGKIIPKVIINLLSYSLSGFSQKLEKNKSIFEELKIPVIQAMSTYQNRDEWDNSSRGLDTESLAINVYYPEFDGQIITVTSCTYETKEDQIGKKKVFIPIEDRVKKIVDIALGWQKLREKNNNEKKIAIIFHNMPPRNDMIGRAFGLDSVKSVYNMLKLFKKNGVKIDYDFRDSNEIIDEIIKGVSNDKKWLSYDKVLEKSVDKIKKDKYRLWFSKLSRKVREEMESQWGEAPGEFMVYNETFPIPGILNGNVFIGLQPARGMEEKAEEIYHSTDFVIPHQYYAFYKWIKEEFKADVIYHMGTHGTLEWLPGKEVGLSKNCYPDFNISDIPHLYPYSINISGEGLQAKRRSNAVLISHMIPPLTLADKYDEIDKIDELIKEFYQAFVLRDPKLSEIKLEIKEAYFKNNYQTELNITSEEIDKDFQKFLDKFQSYLDDIKSFVIKDGLHILGEVPEIDKLIGLIYQLLKIGDSEILPIDEIIGKVIEYDIKELKNNPYSMIINGKNNLIILEEIREISHKVIEGILKNIDYNEINGYILKNKSYLETLKSYILNVVLPKINGIENENKSILAGMDGQFIKPGQSGYPTRGNLDILPTGTNFYALDPNKIPTKAAWKIGKKLGELLIERYKKDEGKIPTTIAMILYSGDTIKTNGDDIAEILYLLGVKPIWEKSSGKVVDLEVIPLNELKRPRIDVILRISGLFRDTFPNLIYLLEKAINLIAELNENDEQNYIKKNIKDEVLKLMELGYEKSEAKKLSKVRVFSCPPGTYGTGVRTLIESKQWENRDDLGKAYISWSSYGYNSNYHGKQMKISFIEKLKHVSLTVKNEASNEIDMLESDDYYAYHGGLGAAIKYVSQKNIRSYSGNTSNPEEVKIRDIKEEGARIMRARILNPKWIKGLKSHDYKGAVEMSAMLDTVFGWDATSDIIENWMYDKIFEKYIKDNVTREWIEKNNKHALLNMSERLLELEKRKMWETTEENLQLLRKIYLEIEGEIEEYQE